MTLRKPVKKRDPEYLAWIRKQPCLASGVVPSDGYTVEAHHVWSKVDGGTRTKPADYRAVPLRPEYHREYHEIGKEAFELKYGLDFEMEIWRLTSLYAVVAVKREKKERKQSPVVKVSVKHCPCKREHSLKVTALIVGKQHTGYFCPKLGWVKVERRTA